jgi:hypothetical protein
MFTGIQCTGLLLYYYFVSYERGIVTLFITLTLTLLLTLALVLTVRLPKNVPGSRCDNEQEGARTHSGSEMDDKMQPGRNDARVKRREVEFANKVCENEVSA